MDFSPSKVLPDRTPSKFSVQPSLREEPGAEPAAPRMRARTALRTWIVLGLVLVLVEFAYVFIISAGTFTDWRTYSNYYDLQAEGFRRGQLDLPIEPYPQLVAQADPYDPVHSEMWLWDASLYGGKYFLYWGPLPPLLQAAVKSVLGISGLVGDQYLYFAFASLYLLFGTMLLERLARRLFPGLPLSLLVLAVCVFAFANPVPHGLASASVYQTAIMSGQALTLLGLCFAFDAVWRAGGGEKLGSKLVMAGSAWGLALACRVSLAPALGALMLLTVVMVARARSKRFLPALSDALRLGLPVAAAVAVLLLYNKLRFDSWTEFGVSFQLGLLRFHTSLSNIPMNLYSYALRPFEWSCRFPFAMQVTDINARGVQAAEWLQAGVTTPEPVAGFLLAVPWTWLIPIGAVVCSEFGVRRFLAPDGPEHDRRRLTAVWCCAGFAILASVTAIIPMLMFVSTMRYLTDFTAGIVLMGVMCAWCLYAVTSGNKWMRRVEIAACGLLAAATVILGLLLSVQSYHSHFEANNPALYEKAVEALSFCSQR